MWGKSAMNETSVHTEQSAERRRRISVLVADKNAHFRETIRRVLARLGRCIVSGEASSVTEVISQVTSTQFDLILLDIDMVTKDKLAELKRLARQLPDLQVAVLLSDDTPEYRQAVQSHGVHFCVAKDSLEDQLPPVLNSVLVS
ncbi:MAG: hypothetical protein A2Y74_07255 [Actinobacteria bacterium RBG_13_63_9]|nr:MAG: hypothetical protein A2Y74_07255 [Actinobacteria bacterium RBG_13_63_9]